MLGGPSWGMRNVGGRPGFSQGYGKRTTTTYLRFGADSGLEPLVLDRRFHGIRQGYLEISEEFRHYHDLFDAGDGRLLRFDDDGTEQDAVIIEDGRVQIRTQLLRQFQAGRQLDLVLCVDSVEDFPGVKVENAVALREAEQRDDSYLTFAVGEHMDGTAYYRYFGKRILVAPQRKFAGIWPFEAKDQHYPDFIVDTDDNGQDVRSTCDPEVLQDADGDGPASYLTPVHFDRDVLRRYYDQPEKYAVEDGRLTCGFLWGLDIDNDHPDRVVVFLGDVGGLPARERDHWRTHNIAPPGGMSTTAISRAFLARAADGRAPDFRFRRLYARTQDGWLQRFGWDLFRAPNLGDEHLLQRVRVPLNASVPEFDAQVLVVAKLVCDSLNDKALRKALTTPPPDNTKSIGKLELWLTQEGYPEVTRDIGTLRAIFNLR